MPSFFASSAESTFRYFAISDSFTANTASESR